MDDSTLWFLSVIAGRTAVVLVALVAGIRVFGKRDFGGMNVYDLVLVLLLANAVQNAMTEGSGLLWVGIVSAGTLMVAERLFGALLTRRPLLEAHLVGTPTVIVEHGRVDRPTMHRQGVTDEELAAAIRAYGLDSLRNVRLAVLEADGSISIVPTDQP
ncbi:MAG: DUF421 domain-containing protein [Chloroflexota bacterium]